MRTFYQTLHDFCDKDKTKATLLKCQPISKYDTTIPVKRKTNFSCKWGFATYMWTSITCLLLRSAQGGHPAIYQNYAVCFRSFVEMLSFIFAYNIGTCSIVIAWKCGCYCFPRNVQTNSESKASTVSLSG